MNPYTEGGLACGASWPFLGNSVPILEAIDPLGMNFWPFGPACVRIEGWSCFLSGRSLPSAADIPRNFARLPGFYSLGLCRQTDVLAAHLSL